MKKIIKEFVSVLKKKMDYGTRSRLKRRKDRLERRLNKGKNILRRRHLSRIKKTLRYKLNKERMLQRGLTPTGKRRVLYVNKRR